VWHFDQGTIFSFGASCATRLVMDNLSLKSGDFQMKTIVGIAVAAALSVGAAHAAINPPGAGQGELVEWVIDNTTNQVYARGLQIDETAVLPASSLVTPTAYAAVAPGPVSTGTTFQTVAPDANLTTFLAQNGGHDSFSFGILGAGKATGGATGTNPGAIVVEFTSPLSIAASNLNVPSGTGIQTAVNSVSGTIGTINSVLGASSAPGTSGNVSSQFSPTSPEFALYSNTTAVAAFGTDVNLYAITGNNSKSQIGQLYTAGEVTMLANGTLESVGGSPPPPPVPLPAAIWLLGSGLLGLAGVGRRRAA
jgi:hypothetical protein